MDLPGLNKILDTLGDALGVFDFSFFISGFTTFCFLMLEVHHYNSDILYKLLGWEMVVVVILIIYICGLMSWTLGKMIRWLVLCICHCSPHGIRDDLRKVMQKTQEGLGVPRTMKNFETVYSKMWVDLSEKEEGMKRIPFINQMWVKRAVFEGLITSWLVGFMVACDVDCYQKLLNLTENSCLPCILKVTMIVLVIVSVYTGTEYARVQIKEVVIAHHKICSNNGSN